MSKRKAPTGPLALLDYSDTVEIKPLGAGSEVGRSCIMLGYQGKSVMLDCGIHPGFSGEKSLPFLDGTDLAEVDVALITHFHLDHCAAVPYLLQKTPFKGAVFMTHPTKAIYNSLLKDFARMSKGGKDEALYTEADLQASMDKIEVVDFHQTIEVKGIKITPYRAGHVLGAAMFMVEIAGMRCLYTGDYSRISDRHLPAADLPSPAPHIVICEATYGVSRHLPREQREARFLERVHTTILRGGRVLLPVVALGRAQELLLLLEEYWESKPELHGVPIYQASGMMRKAMSVYETYVGMMNDDIKRVFDEPRNPFDFRHVIHLKSTNAFDDVRPCVLMATPSGLQAGVSRDVFEGWCEDARNAVIICDFAVSGTLAREILGGPTTVLSKTGTKLQLRMSVDNISFSAHADFEQTSGFLDALQPPNVVLVHGEKVEMGRLKGALERGATALGFVRTVHTPENLQPVQITHKPERLALVSGRLAAKPLREGQSLRGVLVRDGLVDQILDPEDLPAFSKLYRGRVSQRQAIPVAAPFSEVRLALEVMFEGVEGSGHLAVASAGPSDDDESFTQDALVTSTSVRRSTPHQAVIVGGVVTVTHRTAGKSAGQASHVLVEWDGGRASDMVADAVVAVILQTAGEPAAATAADQARRQALLSGDEGSVVATELHLIAALMTAQFGPATVDDVDETVRVQVDDKQVVINHATSKVVCDDVALRGRVEKALMRITQAMRPCPIQGAGVS